MRVALIGATGSAGSRILHELVQRGHQVTAIVRNPERVPSLPGVTAKQGDVLDQKQIANLVAGHDAVISAIHFTASDPHKLIGAVRQSGVSRYIVVGGAGSLEVAPGVRLIDTPRIPAAVKPEASAGGAFLDMLHEEQQLDWTFLSPSVMFIPGTRTGKFRLVIPRHPSPPSGQNLKQITDHSEGDRSSVPNGETLTHVPRCL